MAKNILDVAPVARVVKTEKYGDLEVTGLTISGIVHLVKNHPEVFKMFNAKGEQQMEIASILNLGEEISAEFLAAGLGSPGNEQVIETCKMMNPVDTWNIAEAIIEESFPGGAANFFERVMAALEKSNLLQASEKFMTPSPEANESQSEAQAA